MAARRLLCAVTGAAVAVVVVPPAAGAGAGITSRVSVTSTGRQSNGESVTDSISGDGRFVAFYSDASNLVPGDTNASYDVFVRDRLAGVIRRVSVGSAAQSNGDSYQPAISADGRYVAFTSTASNLVAGDTNQTADVFVRDRLTGVNRRVSVASTGRQANGGSDVPAISADGRFVAFYSSASNLVPGDTNGAYDVFVRDTWFGLTRRVSIGAAGQGNADSYVPSISANGQFVTFSSFASNLVPSDTNGVPDVFVRDLAAGVTQRVSIGAAGQGNAGSGAVEDVVLRSPISADGRFVAFPSEASNLVRADTNGMTDVFVRDRLAGQTRRVSLSSNGRQGNGRSGDEGLSMSANGRYVAFSSVASNLVPRDTNDNEDVFVRDRLAGTTQLVSVGARGEGNSTSRWPAMTANGTSVAFISFASNLVKGDTNDAGDVFVRDPLLDAVGPAQPEYGPG